MGGFYGDMEKVAEGLRRGGLVLVINCRDVGSRYCVTLQQFSSLLMQKLVKENVT